MRQRGGLLSVLSADAPLTQNLVGFWEFDDATEELGRYALTEWNAPTYGAGLVGNAVTLASASTQYLDRAYTDALSPPGDFEWFGWVNFTTVGADRMLVNMGNANAGNYPHSMAYELMYVNSGTKFRWTVGNDTTSLVLSSTFGAPSTGTWYAVNAWHQAGVGLGLKINNGAGDTGAYVSGSYHPAYNLTFGKWTNFNGARHNGLLDQWGFWSRLLTAQERTFLYNAGAGRTYAQIRQWVP